MGYVQCHYPFENKELFEGGFPADFIAEGLDQASPSPHLRTSPNLSSRMLTYAHVCSRMLTYAGDAFLRT
jgi:hypothetical protein